MHICSYIGLLGVHRCCVQSTDAHSSEHAFLAILSSSCRSRRNIFFTARRRFACIMRRGRCTLVCVCLYVSVQLSVTTTNCVRQYEYICLQVIFTT